MNPQEVAQELLAVLFALKERVARLEESQIAGLRESENLARTVYKLQESVTQTQVLAHKQETSSQEIRELWGKIRQIDRTIEKLAYGLNDNTKTMAQFTIELANIDQEIKEAIAEVKEEQRLLRAEIAGSYLSQAQFSDAQKTTLLQILGAIGAVTLALISWILSKF